MPLNSANLEARLQVIAARGGTKTYGELARESELRVAELTSALEVLMEADYWAGRPILAAVCAGRMNNGMPAEGFFIKALELGINVGDRAQFIVSQRSALRALYGGATPPE
jgi:hypothetical protein